MLKKLYFSFLIVGMIFIPQVLHAQENDQTTLWTEISTHSLDDQSFGDETFFKYQEKVYTYVYEDKGDQEIATPIEIKKADAATFEETVNPAYGRDKNAVYYREKKIKGADPKTFSPLEEFVSYGEDKNGIYYQDQKMEKPDKDSFEIISEPYSRDKKHIYYASHSIQNVDMKTWEMIDEEYSKDQKNVYWLGKKMNGIDPATFKVLEESFNEYVQDKNGIYYEGEKIAEADPSSFKILENFYGDLLIRHDYAKDSENVYFQGKVIPDADPDSFSIGSNKYAQDATNVFFETKKLNLYTEKKPNTIEVKLFWTGPVVENGNSNLVSTTRYIPKTKAVATSTLKLLLLGPSKDESDQNYSTFIALGGEIKSLTIKNGEAKVVFKDYSIWNNADHGDPIIEQITQTLLQFPSIKKVTIMVDGETIS